MHWGASRVHVRGRFLSYDARGRTVCLALGVIAVVVIIPEKTIDTVSVMLHYSISSRAVRRD
ncbi:hypothetical protein GCM10010407_08590 [Rarobacter incanus]